MTENRLLYGATLIITAEFMFALMGATIRQLAADLDIAMIVFARNLVGLGIVIGLSARTGLGDLATQIPALHLLRGVAGIGAMYCFFFAIANMPLAEAMLLKLTAPLFMPLVALLWLKEGFTWHVAAALGVGFIGVGLILSPDFGQLQPVALIALLGGALAAVAKVTVRRLSADEPAIRIVFYFAAIGTAVSAIPALWSWQSPGVHHLAWIALLGLCATGGQFLLTRGMASAPAARLAPFTFFSVVFGALLGWLLWDELLRWTTLAGALFVLVAALLVGRGRQERPPEARRIADAPTLL